MTAAQSRKSRAKRFRLFVQHEGQMPLRMAFESADTAIGWATDAHDHGATTARVERVDPGADPVLVLDAVTGFELPISQWNG